ncbi:MAG: hypothetical protein LBT64_01555, partial [Puniceicoccales bacterium]|nr:hypothetical protein [Puniceicoccales bacterium]
MQLEATKSFATNQGNLIENIKGTIEANKEHVNMLTTAAEYNKEVVLKSLDDMKREAKTKFKAIAATIVEAGKVVVALPNLWDNIQENKVKIEENQKQVTDLLGKSVEQLSDMQRWLFESIEKVQEEVRKNELEIKEGIAKMKNDLMEEEENIKKMKVNIQVFDQKIQKKLEEYALLRSKLDERKKGLGFKENVRATFRPGGVESAAKITKEMERKVNETRNEIENLQGQLTEQKNELESAQANLALHANGLREITGLSSEMVEKCREMEENTAKLKVAVAQIPYNVGNIASRASNISGNTASATGDIATATAGSPASSNSSMAETMFTGIAGASAGIAVATLGTTALIVVGAPLTLPLLGVTVVATGTAVGSIYAAKVA